MIKSARGKRQRDAARKAYEKAKEIQKKRGELELKQKSEEELKEKEKQQEAQKQQAEAERPNIGPAGPGNHDDSKSAAGISKAGCA